ncbi:MAG: SOS response-associated peptidase [Bacteroidia bacterium]|jgi:putative SOS response-associated peptidase YedK
MCYDAKSGLKLAIKYAKHRSDDPEIIAALEKELEKVSNHLEKYFYVSGFTHPKLLVFTNQTPFIPQAFVWGLIPNWVKNKQQAQTAWNYNLNAKGETIFEKPSFQNSAKNKRCLIYLDAFYEHHHAYGKTFPYHIAPKNGEPLALAGLWDEWVDSQTGEVIKTCSIVTTKGNKKLSKIHNNPQINEPRMPVILTKESQNNWLIDCKNDANKLELLNLVLPFADELLETHTVRNVRGKNAFGNLAGADEEYIYKELVEPFTLF